MHNGDGIIFYFYGSWRSVQARAEDFQIGEALIFPARGAREKFLSATPKFLSATPIFGF